MYALILFLSLWPFSPTTGGPGHSHSRPWHARHLRHLQASRARTLAHHTGQHPFLANR